MIFSVEKFSTENIKNHLSPDSYRESARIFMQRTTFNFFLAIEGVFANKLRAMLTALGIVFGVGAVIAMLAIGTGAKQRILEQMKLIGTNNIVVKSVVLKGDEGEEQTANTGSSSNGQNEDGKRPWSPGLTMEDVRAIQTVLPNVDEISPEIVLPTTWSPPEKRKKPSVSA
ncbi:MAG: ABC transporter permease [Bacteroidota bacterium]